MSQLSLFDAEPERESPQQAAVPTPTPTPHATASPLAGLRHDHIDLPALQALLEDWATRGWLRELDRAFADFLMREADDASPLLILAAALASHQLGRGHVCLALDATLDDASFVLSLPPEGDALRETPLLPTTFFAGLTLPAWIAQLHHPLLVGEREGSTPLVLIGTRLYLRRYWQYERQVHTAIARLLGSREQRQAALPTARLRTTLDILFPSSLMPARAVNWQKLACALVAAQGFGIITGGPGTGKTTTVVRLLALLQSVAMDDGTHAGKSRSGLRIRLAAPTGKAAARLNESIAKAVADLPLDGLPQAERVRSSIPTDVTTLHRLLGSRPDTRHFSHNAHHPLALDVLVIDEASMVDLEMMAAVLSAMPPSAQLLLLGDKDQLASVEAGAVLGELCRHAREGRYTDDTCTWLEAASGEQVDSSLRSTQGRPLDQAVAMLRESYRFTAESGIGQLAEAVNAGAVAQTRAVWARAYPDLARQALSAPTPSGTTAQQVATVVPASVGDDALRRLVIDGGVAKFPNSGERRADSRGKSLTPPVGYRHYLEILHRTRPDSAQGPLTQLAWDEWARGVLEAYGSFQLLCGLRRGHYGVEGLNQRIAGMLRETGLIRNPFDQLWYAGRPVLVTRNDYGLGVMNGDIGITLEVPAVLASTPTSDVSTPQKTVLRVAFLSSDASKGIKWILPSRLQAVETVFAMTVHKSQGSEFVHAALVLPERLNPILTRELVYTGITRARHWFTLASAGRGLQVFEEAIARQVQRASGLNDDRASD